MKAKNIKLSNGQEIEIPSIDISQNTWGLLLASRIKLSNLLTKKESKRTEIDNIKIDFVNAIIINCQIALNMGVLPEIKYFLNSKMKVVA